MNPMNGLLLIDKPIGVTSHDVVGRARRILGMRGIGHAGTLDPLASGLLVLLIGEATKVSDYILNGDKSYELKARLGVTTDSMDMTGVVTREAPVTSSPEDVRRAALALQGPLTLKVPIHSAVKVDGKKLYEFAHKGETPDHVPDREMTFFDVEVVETAPEGAVVRMRCSKGSFIRAWANKLGEDLGCGASVEALRRIESQPYGVSQAISLEELEAKWESRSERHGRVLGPAWVALKDAVSQFKRIDIDGHDEKLLRNGQISKMVQAQLLQHVTIGNAPPGVRVVSRETDDLIAILTAENGQFYKIKRVFNRT
ncbi:MAG: tRNA pseudouridine(55) synthase TruB [Bdellovibrionota bacterium]